MRLSTAFSFTSVASLVAAVALVPIVVTSCADESGNTEPITVASGEYHGLMTTPAETGTISLTMGSDARTASLHPLTNGPSSVSGTMALTGQGGVVTLTGSYDPATGRLVLTATTPRGTYTLDGISDANGFSGTATSPSGTGTFSLAAGPAGSVALYCGTYSGDASGIWNIIVGSNGSATGAHCDAKGCGALLGNVQGSTLTIQDPKAPDLQSSGTIAGDDVSGTWSAGSEKGTWAGSKSACQASSAPPPADAGADVVDSGGDASASPTRETIASGLNDIVDLSVDATHAYFLSGADASVKRCPIGGCGGSAPELVVGSLSVPSSVAVSGSTAFWTSGFRYVVSCSTASLPCTGTNFTDLGDSAYPAHLWVANNRLYWIREQGTTRMIETCPIAGCTAGYPHQVYASKSGSLIDNQPLAGLAVTSTHVYVSSFTGGITRYSLIDAENADNASGITLKSTGYGTSNVDSDGTSVRWTVLGEGKVYACAAPDCATVAELLVGQEEPGGTRSDAAFVYGFNRGTPSGNSHVNGTSLVWRLAK